MSKHNVRQTDAKTTFFAKKSGKMPANNIDFWPLYGKILSRKTHKALVKNGCDTA